MRGPREYDQEIFQYAYYAFLPDKVEKLRIFTADDAYRNVGLRIVTTGNCVAQALRIEIGIKSVGIKCLVANLQVTPTSMLMLHYFSQCEIYANL